MREAGTSKQVGCVARTHREAERCVIASSTHPTGCGAGERERSEPALQVCRAPQKAPNEASRVRRKDAPGRWAVRHRKLDAPYKLLKTPKRHQTKPNLNQRKACYRWRLSHRCPGRRVADEADPRLVVRFPTTLATIRSTRSRWQARATRELGAANVVPSFEQLLRMGDLVRGWHGPSLGLAVLFAP